MRSRWRAHRPRFASGEMTYQADSYEGMMKMKAPSMDLSTRYSGERVGHCK